MSIPPKYGRVYTRINGRVSCKAITFPFLRLGVHTRERERVCGYEREKGKGNKRHERKGERARERERGKRGRSREDQNRARDQERRVQNIILTCTNSMRAISCCESTCIATIERSYVHL